MFRMFERFALVFALVSMPAAAQDLPVYTDNLQNGFGDWSYNGGSNFANGAPTHNGSADSIAFTGDAAADNAVSLEHTDGGGINPAPFAAGTYSGLRLFVNGGATGGQQLRLMLQVNGGTPVLPSAVTLPAAPANSWLQIDIAFSSLAFNNDGSFDRIDLSPSVSSQATVYIDDVSLVAAGGGSSNYIFGDSFEPEYMFVPQYNQGGTGAIKVYQRTTNTSDFTLVNTATLPANANPNAVSIAKDGGLWVVDDGNHKLLRFTLQSVVGTANPAPTASVGPVAGSPGLYDLAFFGDNAYVSSDNGILKYPVAAMTANTNPVPTTLSSGVGATPVGLAFDAQGHLWICNYGIPGNLVRMTTAGTIEVTINNGNIIDAEGLAFDEFGSLWFGNNSDNTLYAFGSQQITASGSPNPIGQINTPSGVPIGGGVHPTGYAGGIIFDRRGDLRANYEYDYTVRAYNVSAAPWGGPYTSYTSIELTALPNATTDPGRGGIAIWPVPHTVHR